MGQLIAIILAIILGAYAAILQVINLGNGFSNKSADVVALHFLQNATTLESAMAVYKAQEAASAYTTDLAGTVGELQTLDLVKEVPAPVDKSTFALELNGTDLFMTATGSSAEVCAAFNKVKGADSSFATLVAFEAGDARYGCTTDGVLVYKVE